MNNIKNSVFYVSVIGGFTALIYWVISKGASLEVGRGIVQKKIESNPVSYTHLTLPTKA